MKYVNSFLALAAVGMISFAASTAARLTVTATNAQIERGAVEW